MSREAIPCRTLDWSGISREEHKGETGTSFWRTVQLPGPRIRMVEQSAGYRRIL